MHQTTAIKSDRLILVIKTPKISKGHMPHRSGAGTHADRRLKRQKTRSCRIRAAFQE